MNKFFHLAFSVIIALFYCNGSIYGQESNKQETPVQQQFVDAIEDNSYFLEEAYNQEKRVVQHIFGCNVFSSPSKDIMFSFTQEWPAFGQGHQLSFTIPFNSFNSGEVKGLGDIFLNYRYQMFLTDKYAFSPRLSVAIPTGKVDDGLGYGTVGIQLNLPLTIRISDYFATHINGGVTLYPSAKLKIGEKEFKENLTNYNLGASFIWLATRRFNIMLEVVSNFNYVFDDVGTTKNETELIVAPCIRYSIPVESLKLEIVPGLAFPTLMAGNESRTGVFFYLSFEHDY